MASGQISSLWASALWGGGVPGGGAVAGLQARHVGQGILYPALRKAGVTLGPQRTPSPAQFQDAIDELNRLSASLNCDRLFIYSIARSEYPLNPPKATYTIGISNDPAATVDFAAQRPQMIERANIIVQAGTQPYPLEIVTDLQWADVGAPVAPGTIPELLYNDRAYPVSTLYLYGQPATGQSLELFTWARVPEFQSTTDVVLFPQQYEDALVLNLAVRLAPHFQLPVNVDVRNDAQKSLMRLESINAPQPIASLGFGGCGCDFDIYSGR